jgi:hypothetical protein
MTTLPPEVRDILCCPGCQGSLEQLDDLRVIEIPVAVKRRKPSLGETGRTKNVEISSEAAV